MRISFSIRYDLGGLPTKRKLTQETIIDLTRSQVLMVAVTHFSELVMVSLLPAIQNAHQPAVDRDQGLCTRGSPHDYAYDDNVTGTAAAADHSTATYRYDASGNTLAATGSHAAPTRDRISTNPLHAEVTGTPLYYGYSYDDPPKGMWPSRDPIEEEGGLNLYGFVGNDPNNWFDDLGHEPRQARDQKRSDARYANKDGQNRNKTNKIGRDADVRADQRNKKGGTVADGIGEVINTISDIQGLKTILAVERKCKSLAQSKKKSEGWKSCRACCLHTFIAPSTPSGRIIRNDLTYLDYTVYEGQCRLSMRDQFKGKLGAKLSQEYILGNGEIVTPRMGQSVILNHSRPTDSAQRVLRPGTAMF